MRGATAVYCPGLRGKADFNPRSPCGERPTTRCSTIGKPIFQSTLPMRGATAALKDFLRGDRISIHAPHAGSDFGRLKAAPSTWISIHAPHAGSDNQVVRAINEHYDFNPRSPCGERRFVPVDFRRDLSISIHAPHAGSDPGSGPGFLRTLHFNPRSPCGERPILF